MPALPSVGGHLAPQQQAGLGSGLGTAAREVGASPGVAVTDTAVAGRAGFADGMGPALRTVAVVAATAPVALGHGRGPASATAPAAGPREPAA
ncbi:hypothetical protein [Streptomyces phaeoluteigriseus]